MTRLTYAIGDVHGRLDLLLKAFEKIEAHGRGDDVRVVLLGDYVDRGPDSRGVVDYLIANPRRLRMTCLKGNHEAMMIEAIRGGTPSAVSRWLFYGGAETLRSYGWVHAQGRDLSMVPRDHVEWLDALPLMVRDDRRIFVHAGLHPDRPLDAQDEAVCLWIRERFLAARPDEFDWHVVHGHTPEWRDKPNAAEAECLAHRTNLDTGAYYTGVLSIGVFAEAVAGGPVELLKV